MQISGDKKRRLACEQAIDRKFKTFKACAEACEKHARKMGIPSTWSQLSVQHYATCYADFSMRRIKVLADLLGFTDLKEMDEKYTPPAVRGAGLNWVGDEGSIARDFELKAK